MGNSLTTTARPPATSQDHIGKEKEKMMMNYSISSSIEFVEENKTEEQEPRITTQLSKDGFVKRKGGKRPPKDPSVSLQERISKALQEYQAESEVPNTPVLPQATSENNSSHINTNNTSNAPSSSSTSFETIRPVDNHEHPLTRNALGPKTRPANQGNAGPSRFSSAESLVGIANRISVPADSRPVRRLRQKVISSVGGASETVSERSDSSQSSGHSIREPVELRSFEILKVLGKGSHGKVYLVRHRGNNNFYAMKQLKKTDVIRTKQFDNTMREFRIHKNLTQNEVQCPNIAGLRYAFHSRSRLYMVFDYLSGGELFFHIRERGRLPEALARFYAAQIVLALGYLHLNRIAYRDLKPENLMLDAEGFITLVDLGLCKDGMDHSTRGSSSFCGTTEYLAPEVLQYMEHGLSVDWWAFGMVLYEMLTGLPPWYSYKQEEVVQGILTSEITFPTKMSDAAKDLITRLLDKNPETRLGSKNGADELIEHPFFEAVDWVALARRNVKPPFTPPNTGIACNFDSEFTESKLEAEMDYLPPSSKDPFVGFYYDGDDPVNCGSMVEREVEHAPENSIM